MLAHESTFMCECVLLYVYISSKLSITQPVCLFRKASNIAPSSVHSSLYTSVRLYSLAV